MSEGSELVPSPPRVTEVDYAVVDEGDFYIHIATDQLVQQIWHRVSGEWVEVKEGDRFTWQSSRWKSAENTDNGVYDLQVNEGSDLLRLVPTTNESLESLV